MTEHEWLSSTDPAKMISEVPPKFILSTRQYRMLAVTFLAASDWCKFDRHHDPAPATKCSIIRCIIGNPFALTVLPHSSACPSWVGPKTRIECGCRCDWLTPQVIDLAEAAYLERATRKCEECKAGKIPDLKDDGATPLHMKLDCDICHGTGSIESGELDPARLGILADALIDAGCSDKACNRCEGVGKVSYCSRFMYSCAELGIECKCDSKKLCDTCNSAGRVPHPLLAHLRDPSPHYRGCHVLDTILGKK